MTRMRSARIGWLLLLVNALQGVSAIASASAVSVSPIHVEMTAVGGASRSTVTLINRNSDDLPIEVSVERISIDENGNRSSAKAGDEFLIMPLQTLVPAGASQNIRLQWVGDPELVQSQSYMIMINQIPVKLPVGQKSVQIVTSFGVQVNVAPAHGVPSLAVTGTSTEIDKRTGKRYPVVIVHNPSKTHALLPQSTLRLSAGAWSRSLETAELSAGVGIGLVQPGKRRRFVVPVDLPANVTKFHAQLDFRRSR